MDQINQINKTNQMNQRDQRGGEPIRMLVAPAFTRRDEPVPFTEALLYLCRATHLPPDLLILAGSASYMARQSVPFRPQYKWSA